MDLSKEIWHCELYKLQQQSPKPVIVKCNSNVGIRPEQFGEEYHGNIDRNAAERIMSNYGTGAFLIRDSETSAGEFRLVIRFDQSNKSYVLHYKMETRQHYVGYKYFDKILDLVQDGLIHMYIETRGAHILSKISEAKVYESTPFYQSRLHTIKNETLRHKHGENYGYNNHGDYSMNKEVLDSSLPCNRTANSIAVDQEDVPVATQSKKFFSLRQKPTSRPSISSESSTSIFSSSKSTQSCTNEPISPCATTLPDNASLDSVDSNSKIQYQSIQSLNQRHGNRVTYEKRWSNRNTLIETSTMNYFSQIEKSHNFKQRTFVGPQWCDFCAHFMWGLVAQGVQCFDCGFQAHKKCSDKVAADCLPVMKRLKRVFGVELTSLAKMENRAVPMIFEKLITTLENRDLTFQGLYRISGNIDLIEDVKADLDKDIDSVDLNTDPRLSEVETLTGLIKLFLRQLPIPLITSDLYPDLISILKTESDINIRQTKFRETLSTLNSVHHATLEFFIRHLNTVSKFDQQNCMTSSNLAIVFAPTLISKPTTIDSTTDLSPIVLISRMQADFKWDCTIVQELIDGSDSIFTQVTLNES